MKARNAGIGLGLIALVAALVGVAGACSSADVSPRVDASLGPRCAQPGQGCPCSAGDPPPSSADERACAQYVWACKGTWQKVPVGAPRPTPPVPEAGPSVGNPLCHIDPNGLTCSPDETYRFESGSCVKQHVDADGGDGGDAGDESDAGDGGDAGDESTGACRLNAGPLRPTCSDKVTAAGGDGASCIQGADCASGFDCVADSDGKRTCRHYCCAGTCKGELTQTGGTFCDVQPLVETNQYAPVCMPIKRCQLLGTDCAAGETCAVVTESGDTGCVTIGTQSVGQSCDEGHCVARTTCLGQPGARKCYVLCRVGSNDCGVSSACETSTLFKDPTFGTCQAP